MTDVLFQLTSGPNPPRRVRPPSTRSHCSRRARGDWPLADHCPLPTRDASSLDHLSQMGRHTLHDTRHPPCSSCVTLKRSLLSRQCEEEEEGGGGGGRRERRRGGRAAGNGRWAMVQRLVRVAVSPSPCLSFAHRQMIAQRPRAVPALGRYSTRLLPRLADRRWKLAPRPLVSSGMPFPVKTSPTAPHSPPLFASSISGPLIYPGGSLSHPRSI
ncbi:hypothetical protein QBC39DRAFT_52805 [Podospora conica]|nr:hypothetical protein QBC39DRAFT_52805 [Schizothecium conicum]